MTSAAVATVTGESKRYYMVGGYTTVAKGCYQGLEGQLPIQLARTHPTLFAKNIWQIKLVVLIHGLDHLLRYATNLLTPAANYVKKQVILAMSKSETSQSATEH